MIAVRINAESVWVCGMHGYFCTGCEHGRRVLVSDLPHGLGCIGCRFRREAGHAEVLIPL